MSIEDQIGQLVTKITGLTADSSDWSKAVQRSKYKLRYEKCTSTSEKEVNDSYGGLVEKFAIKGHTHLSKNLMKYKTEYLQKTRPIFDGETNQLILKYDLLRLLLSLSSSHNQNYGYVPTLHAHSENKNITWEEIIQDEPLRGDHWKSWSDATISDEDELSDPEGFEFDRQELNQTKEKPTWKPTRVTDYKTDYTDQMDIDDREDYEGLNYLMTQQYWRDDYVIDQNNSKDDSMLINPCKLSQALGRLLYSERERRELKTITEAGVMREVLGFLRGYSGVIFQARENTFVMNEKYIVQHLSQQSLGSILKEFYNYGLILSDLRQIADRVLHDMEYGQTFQAFSECMHMSLFDFDSKLATLEADTSMITEQSNKTISILKMKCNVEPDMFCFKAIHDIAKDIPFDSKNARGIATYLISSLYDRILTAETSGQHHLYDTLLYILQKSLKPYGRIMDDWIFFGSLTADKFNEFYVIRNDTISIHDSNFWAGGFSIEPIKQNQYCYECPLFDPQMISHIFFTGKAINLLSHIEKIQKKHSLVGTLSQRLFDEVIKESLAIKQSEPQIPNDKSDYAYTLFPLAKPRKRAVSPIRTASEKSDIGFLLDQQFLKTMEMYIQEPYQFIANDLNRVLHQQCELKEQLESLASIYLMLENDLMHSFCEIVFSKIDQNEPWFEQRALGQMFTEACKTSGYYETAFIETLEVDATKITSVASYLDFISFKIEISWPLNNFIQIEQLPNYSKILSFLFRLKRAKYVMEKKTLFTRRPTAEKTNSTIMYFYSLRMKILWFINAFWRYIMTTILHAETINFRDKLSLSRDADEITALHNSYIRRLIDRCLLNEKASAIRKSIMSILDMTEQMKSFFVKYIEPNQDVSQLSEALNTIEKDFNRTNEFITISLMILGRKAGLPWFESLATSLSAQ